MFVLVDILYVLAASCYLPILAWQMIRQNKNRTGWSEKFGNINLKPGPRRIWIHAVSLGEVNATRQLVAGLEKHCPNHDIVISTTTDTGYARACTLYGQHRVFRYPLDFSWVVHRVINTVQPDLIVLMELEVWYNLIHIAHKRNIPVTIANGRLTKRSAKRFQLGGPIIRSMFQRLSWVGAQDDTIADRFTSLSTPAHAVQVVGSVKWDTAQITDTVEGAQELLTALGINPAQPLWVCGSTGPGEENIILDAYDRLPNNAHKPQLTIVPRKPERFDEVASLIKSKGYNCIRRSQHPDNATPPALTDKPPVILGDTMGELRKFYALATTVFIGRSLVPMGGSDPMEIAALGKPIIAGPYMENFADPTAKLKSAGALIEINSVDELASVVAEHCQRPQEAEIIGKKGQHVVRQNQGATDHTIRELIRLIEPQNS